jgi:hypothetical protein
MKHLHLLVLLVVPLLVLSTGVTLSQVDYNLPRQYSSSQGDNNWFYYYGTPSSHSQLTWDNYVEPWGTLPRYDWNGGPTNTGPRYLEFIGRDLTDWTQIGAGDCNGVLQPGENADITIGWQAPTTGTVYISAMLNAAFQYADAVSSNDDGVYFYVYDVDTLAGQVHVFRGNNEENRIHNANITTSVNVSAGDFIYFWMNRGNWQDADGMYYSFTVSYNSGADLVPPISSHDVQGNQLQLFAEDAQSGVAALEYAQYYPEWGGWHLYTEPITLPVGTSRFMYRAIDNMGNAEPYHRLTLELNPTIAVSPSSFNVSLQQTNSITQTMTISNTGTGTLTWQVGEVVNPNAKIVAGQKQIQPKQSYSNSSLSKSTERASGKKGTTSSQSAKPLSKMSTIDTTGGRILLLASEDDWEYMMGVKSVLVSTGAFSESDIDAIDYPYSLTLEELLPYSAVLVWSDYDFEYPQLIGDVLQQYVDAGGGVVLSTYCFSTDWAIQGGILNANYSPFLPAYLQSVSSTLDMSSIPQGHPIFDGIVNAPEYWSNSNYSNPPLNTGGTLLATDTYGNNLIAENPTGKVVAINIFPAELYAGNAEAAKLFANALLYVEGGGKWFGVSPRSGTVAAGSSQDVNVIFRAYNLEVGVYNDAITITSNDQVNSWITGFVGDNSTESPLAGATVAARNEAGGTFTATTDATGNYAIEVPTFGGYNVMFGKPGYVPEWWAGYGSDPLIWNSYPVSVGKETQQPDSVTGINAYLDRGGVIKGRVIRGGQGKNATILVHSTNTELVGLKIDKIQAKLASSIARKTAVGEEYPLMYVGRTGENGYYQIPVLPGPYFVQFWPDSLMRILWYNQKFAPPFDTVKVKVVNDTAKNINADFTPGRTVIAGRVVDTEGSPLVGNVIAVNNEMENARTWTATTNRSGYYDLPVPQGIYKVVFFVSGYIQAWWAGGEGQANFPWNASDIYVGENYEAPDSVGNINGALERGAVVRGSTTLYNEPEQTGIYVTNAENESWDWCYYTHSLSDGKYEMALPPGKWFVYFERDRWNKVGQWDREWIWYNQKVEWPFDTVIVDSVKQILNNISAEFGLPPEMQAVRILSIRDVPNDEGKNVFVIWRALQNRWFDGGGDRISLKVNDGIEYPPITAFSILRRDGAVWTQVGRAEVQLDTLYSLVVPTLYDSTKSKGIFWSKYKVTAHTVLGQPFYSSIRDSGYSVDNIVPIAPVGLKVNFANTNLVISWDSPLLGDEVVTYRIYRSTSSTFQIGPTNIYRDGLKTTSFTDEGVVGSSTKYYYKITALDDAENESGPSLMVSNIQTGVLDENALPIEFSLYQNYPNPFNPSTVIAYDLPDERHVTLKVFNTLGQEVASLVDGMQPVGRYTVTFDARKLASGLYIYRLTAGDNISIKKMSLVK